MLELEWAWPVCCVCVFDPCLNIQKSFVHTIGGNGVAIHNNQLYAT